VNSFNLKIVTLDGIEYEGDALSVVARTTSGDVCILKNHANYVAPIEVGKIKIKETDKEKVGACAGGFISVLNNNVRIVATTFEFSEDIDTDRANKAKIKAEKRLLEDKNSKMAEIKLKKALLRLEVSQKK